MVEPSTRAAADTIGVEREAQMGFDAGAAVIAGLIIGAASLLFLAGVQFIAQSYELRGHQDPGDALRLVVIGQLIVAVVGFGLSRLGLVRADLRWERSVGGAGCIVSGFSCLVSAVATVYVLTQ